MSGDDGKRGMTRNIAAQKYRLTRKFIGTEVVVGNVTLGHAHTQMYNIILNNRI